MSTAAEFAALTTPHVPRLYRLGLRLTQQPSDAADLVQEALCKAWASWSKFDRSGNAVAYVSRILVNAFISRHRHSRVVLAVQSRCDLIPHLFDENAVAASESPEHAWHAPQLSDEVLAALEILPPHYRCVVELVDLGGMPYRDAADQLDVPLGTVMSRLHRARKIMRTYLTGFARDHGVGVAAAA